MEEWILVLHVNPRWWKAESPNLGVVSLLVFLQAISRRVDFEKGALQECTFLHSSGTPAVLAPKKQRRLTDRARRRRRVRGLGRRRGRRSDAGAGLAQCAGGQKLGPGAGGRQGGDGYIPKFGGWLGGWVAGWVWGQFGKDAGGRRFEMSLVSIMPYYILPVATRLSKKKTTSSDNPSSKGIPSTKQKDAPTLYQGTIISTETRMALQRGTKRRFYFSKRRGFRVQVGINNSTAVAWSSRHSSISQVP